jgi:HSP20 family protein
MTSQKTSSRSFPALRFPFSLFEDREDEWLQDFSAPSGLSVSEDENHVYVEAALPGIDPSEVEMTFHKGMLWIKAEKKEESKDKNRKFYRKASSSFSYHVAVPGNVDENRPPEAICKQGIITVTFDKTKTAGPKKIPVKHG